jgi:hypothetical protein
MNAIISALSLFISTLFGIPARAKAATDAKKAKLGKRLADITIVLDDVLRRADAILDFMQQLPMADSEERKSIGRDLLAVVDKQIVDLKKIGSYFQHEFLWGFEYSSVPKLDSFSLLHDTTDVFKVISIYEPDLGKCLGNILEHKTNLLVELARVLSQELQRTQEFATLRDIRWIDHQVIASQVNKFRFTKGVYEAESKGLVEFEEIDLTDQSSVQRYVDGARSRLNEIKGARSTLAALIRDQFDMHEIT